MNKQFDLRELLGEYGIKQTEICLQLSKMSRSWFNKKASPKEPYVFNADEFDIIATALTKRGFQGDKDNLYTQYIDSKKAVRQKDKSSINVSNANRNLEIFEEQVTVKGVDNKGLSIDEAEVMYSSLDEVSQIDKSLLQADDLKESEEQNTKANGLKDENPYNLSVYQNASTPIVSNPQTPRVFRGLRFVWSLCVIILVLLAIVVIANFIINLFLSQVPTQEGAHLVISQPPTLSKTLIKEDELIEVCFKVKNIGTATFFAQEIVASVRFGKDWDGFPVDFPRDTNLTLKADEERRICKTKRFSAVGEYFVEVTVRANNRWDGVSDKDFKFHRVFFTISKNTSAGFNLHEKIITFVSQLYEWFYIAPAYLFSFLQGSLFVSILYIALNFVLLTVFIILCVRELYYIYSNLQTYISNRKKLLVQI
jgi:hypothetical protein